MDKHMKLKNLVFFGLFLVFLGILLGQKQIAYAANPVTITTVDYEEEEIVIKNNGNTRIFFAIETDAVKDKWDVMKADEGETSRLDFSWTSGSVDNVIFIKGEDTKSGNDTIKAEQKRVVLHKRTSKLDLSINYTIMNTLTKDDSIAPMINIMTTQGNGKVPIYFDDLEWKKGESGKWKTINTLTVGQLEKYQIKGTDLYFRIMAINDVTSNPDGSNGRRASSETKIKIAKKAASTAVGIDGNKFAAKIKYGQEYRVTIGSVTKGWIKVQNRSVKNIPLTDIMKLFGDTSDGYGYTKPFPEMTIEVRRYATNKAPASKITKELVPAQYILPGDTIVTEAPSNSQISITYSGTKHMIVTIPSASSANPYQYTIVKPGEDFNDKTASWSTISKSNPVKILSTKAIQGGTFYIRQKEIKYKKETRTAEKIDFRMASTLVSHEIRYPSVPVINPQSFTFIKGMDYEDIKFDIYLNTIGNIPYDTKIRSIKLGTKEIEFDQSVAPEIPTNVEEIKMNEYVLSVTLKKESLEAMANSRSRALTITYENGIDSSSIKLEVKNATPAILLTSVAEPGSAVGTTKIKFTGDKDSGNSYFYYFSDTPVDKLYKEGYKKIFSTHELKPYTTEEDIETGAGYIIMMEVNPISKTIVKYRSLEITANEIKANDIEP